MLLIGLTGGIACGKSTVSSMLSERHDITVIDADRVVRDLQRPFMPCTRRIARRWPHCVDATTGEINRAALGGVIFSDPRARRELAHIMNRPIFLFMLREMLGLWWRSLFRRLRGDAPLLVVLDVPLLYETGTYLWFVDAVAVVACGEEEQITRLAQRNALTRDEALHRLGAQLPLEEKCRRADRVIRNNSSVEELARAVDDSVAWMRQQSGGRFTRLLLTAALGSAVGVVAIVRLCLRLF